MQSLGAFFAKLFKSRAFWWFVVCVLFALLIWFAGPALAIYNDMPLVISEQDLFLVIAAAIAPFVLEYGGFKNLTRQGFEKTALNKLAEKAPLLG